MDIDICYAINEGYVDYCRVSIVSLLENNRNSNITFHILTDRLSDDAQTRLSSVVRLYGAEVKIYYMDDSRLKGQKTTWSKYGWYRIFAAEVISEDVIELLYLDCDTIVTGDITDLFGRNESNWSLGAVDDYMTIFPTLFKRIGYEQTKGYFCSGVLLMNLDYFRKHNLSEMILEFALENPDKIQFPDQDALNCVCKDSKIRLPLKYGILDPFYRDERFARKFADEIIESLEDPRIVHYAGCAPWVAEYQQHYFADAFWKYAAMIGGIKKRHCCTGLSLLILKIIGICGRLGIKKFYNVLPLHRLSKEEIMRKCAKTLV
jgi:lipopolysaccharide biosynthesis glycosyltransferase